MLPRRRPAVMRAKSSRSGFTRPSGSLIQVVALGSPDHETVRTMRNRRVTPRNIGLKRSCSAMSGVCVSSWERPGKTPAGAVASRCDQSKGRKLWISDPANEEAVYCMRAEGAV